MQQTHARPFLEPLTGLEYAEDHTPVNLLMQMATNDEIVPNNANAAQSC